MSTSEHPLPAQQNKGAARKAQGFATPKEDKKPQCARFLPTRVLPIIFLPGIMGSNLRMSEQRRKYLHLKDNIAWRPDSLGALNLKKNANMSPSQRQLRLDPLQTTVDIYDPSGPADITGDGRHANVKLTKGLDLPLLQNDPDFVVNGRSAVQKARGRGWGEVFFNSYGKFLQHLESRLNNTFSDEKINPEWHDVIGVAPQTWGLHPSLPQQALTEEELKKVATACWLAVYAFGYNWLQSNGDSAKIIASRINALIASVTDSGYECNQVIVVTHSMGGLVGRALIHPDYGNLRDKVLGIVHGVMPAIGAPAAYKRMRAGFEDPGMFNRKLSAIEASASAKVIGNYGDEVTAVLANSPGGLQLLPSDSYGNGWLRIRHNGHDLACFPKNGDPFNEIYKVQNKWYALFREEWINPSKLTIKQGGGTFERTCMYLDLAKNFHQTISKTYHPNIYAHYGADAAQQSFSEVVWEIKNCDDPKGWQDWPIVSDNRQGRLEFTAWDPDELNNIGALPFDDTSHTPVYGEIVPPSAPGDQTVPMKSADDQLRSGAFKGIFRQTGYEHQSSYMNSRAVASTLYSIVRIAQQATWKCERE